MRLTIYSVIFWSILSCSCKSGKMGKVKVGQDGKILSGTTTQKCTPPARRYSNNLLAKVKTEVDSLSKIPLKNIDVELSKTVVKLSDYTSEGLDLDLFLFRICEMANNRGMNPQQTQELIFKAMERWNSNQEVKKKIDYLEEEDLKRKMIEHEALRRDTTPPDFDVYLDFEDERFMLIIMFRDNIPLMYRHSLSGLKSTGKWMVMSHPFNTLYPPKNKKGWKVPIDPISSYVKPESGIDTVNLRFEYKSVSFEKHQDPKLAGVIYLKYLFDWNKASVSQFQ